MFAALVANVMGSWCGEGPWKAIPGFEVFARICRVMNAMNRSSYVIPMLNEWKMASLTYINCLTSSRSSSIAARDQG